jgi:hypothetical protein
MIADKIAQAKKSKQRKWRDLFVIGFGVIIVVALLLYLLTNFKPASDEKAAQNKLTYQRQPVLVTTPEPSDNKSALKNEDQQDSVAARQAYIQAYQYYQTELQPSLSSIAIKRWDQPIADKLQLSESTALEQFTASNYDAALDAINQLTELAKNTLEQSENQYNDAVASVKQAYDTLDYNKALLALDKASLHQKNSPQLNTLSIHVENIPKIKALQQIIRISEIENETEKELQAIRNLAKVDPDWGDYSQRTEILLAQLTTNKFNSAIARAYAALDKNDLNTAKTELNKASVVFPSRQEIKQLSTAIAEQLRRKRLAKNVTNADVAERADDWGNVGLSIKQALYDKPNDLGLTTRLAKAHDISGLKKQMAALLLYPYRLANEAVKVRAKIALIQAESYADDSASLTALSINLADTVDAVNREVAVALVSDGLTSVSLRGVGIVGKVLSKVIQLKPGAYTFEGKRQGYKSKIVTVAVPIDTTSFTLKVVADERI